MRQIENRVQDHRAGDQCDRYRRLTVEQCGQEKPDDDAEGWLTAGSLPPPKARIALMLALASKRPLAAD